MIDKPRFCANVIVSARCKKGSPAKYPLWYPFAPFGEKYVTMMAILKVGITTHRIPLSACDCIKCGMEPQQVAFLIYNAMPPC
jgi:hypothetical protein